MEKFRFIGKSVTVNKEGKTYINVYIAGTGGENYEGCRILNRFNPSKGCFTPLSYSEERYNNVGLSKVKIGDELNVIFGDYNSPVYFMKA